MIVTFHWLQGGGVGHSNNSANHRQFTESILTDFGGLLKVIRHRLSLGTSSQNWSENTRKSYKSIFTEQDYTKIFYKCSSLFRHNRFKWSHPYKTILNLKTVLFFRYVSLGESENEQDLVMYVLSPWWWNRTAHKWEWTVLGCTVPSISEPVIQAYALFYRPDGPADQLEDWIKTKRFLVVRCRATLSVKIRLRLPGS